MEEWFYIMIAVAFLFFYSLLIALFQVISPLTKTKVDDIISDVLNKQKDLFIDFIRKFRKQFINVIGTLIYDGCVYSNRYKGEIMDVISIIQIALSVIGGATVLLNFIAPMTKWKGDDKILAFLKKFLEYVSLNVNDNGDSKLEITIKKQ